jgi:hypothetical protein
MPLTDQELYTKDRNRRVVVTQQMFELFEASGITIDKPLLGILIDLVHQNVCPEQIVNFLKGIGSS